MSIMLGLGDSKWQPYYLALLTALLSGCISIVGFNITSKYQTEQVIIQKQYESKALAYNAFLNQILDNKSPVIFELLSIGEMSKQINTDDSIQRLEDRFGKLSALNQDYKLALSLTSRFEILKLYGSDTVRQYCDDIITVLSGNEHYVDWNLYGSNVNDVREAWSDTGGVMIGWEPKVTHEERLMLVTLAAMYSELREQLRQELQQVST